MQCLELTRRGVRIVAILVATLAVATTAFAQMEKISYQCRLTDESGAPITTELVIEFAIYDSAVGGSEVWYEDGNTVTPDETGLISVILGEQEPLDMAINFYDLTDRWLEVRVDVEGGNLVALTPRRLFTGAAYSLVSGDSRQFGGYMPSHYAVADHTHHDQYYPKLVLSVTDGTPPNTGINAVHWNNLHGVPADFADGTDDGGDVTVTLQDAYDGAGAGAGRTIDTSDGPVMLEGTGGLVVHDQLDAALIRVDGQITVGDPGLDGLIQVDGSNPITLNAMFANTSSVMLPDGAIDFNEIADEPGLSRGNIYLNSVTSAQTEMTDLCSTTITIPETGYVLVQATAGVNLTGPVDEDVRFTYQIDETVAGSANGYEQWVGFQNFPGGMICNSVHTQRLYGKTAGTYTFRLEAMTFGDSGNATFIQSSITAIYFRMAYGTAAARANDQPLPEDAFGGHTGER